MNHEPITTGLEFDWKQQKWLDGFHTATQKLGDSAETMAVLLTSETTSIVTTKGFHTSGDGGGGSFYYDPDKNRNLHDGGTIIDPTNAANLSTWDASAKTTWFTAGTGTGCWVMIYSNSINVSWAGATTARTDAENTDAINKFLAIATSTGLFLIAREIPFTWVSITVGVNQNILDYSKNGGNGAFPDDDLYFYGSAVFEEQVRFSARPRCDNNLLLTSTTPELIYVENDAAANNGRWTLTAASEAFLFKLIDDSNLNPFDIMRTERVGLKPTSIHFKVDATGILANFIFESVESGNLGPTLSIRHNPGSGNMADGDTTGTIRAEAFNDADELTTLADIRCIMDDVSDGTEDARWQIQTKRAGTLASRLNIGSGIFSQNVTGNDKGAGSANFTTIYEDNARVASVAGGTGGSGSAGAGNQHIELKIGGVTYKLLHDGTV